MKKIIWSIIGLLAAVAVAPEASALPVFARQTGMACNACHYQHFPLLNSFGRAFKASAFTLMGVQGRIEGDNNLSIPDSLNMAVFTTTFYQSQTAGTTAGAETPAEITNWGVPGTGGELSLFIGGRVSEFAGFLAEAGLGGEGPASVDTTNNTVPGGGVVGAAKTVMMFPVNDSTHIGTAIFTSPDQGVAYGFELLNTGAAATHKLMGNGGPADQHIRAAYAGQYIGTKTAATGISLIGTNDLGFLNVAAYEMAGNDAVGGANSLNLNYVRLATIMDVAGFDAAFGIQNYSGKSTVTNVQPKATIVDAQFQGDLNEMPVGLYVSYGTAAASGDGIENPFNTNLSSAGGKTKTSFNIAAEVGFMSHMTAQVALRKANNGAASNNGDDAVSLGLTYELAQNMGLSLHHTRQSGSYWTADSANEPVGKNATTLLLETAF